MEDNSKLSIDRMLNIAAEMSRSSQYHEDMNNFGTDGLKPDNQAACMPSAEVIYHMHLPGAGECSMTASEIADGIRSGIITGDMPVWRQGLGGWLPVSLVDEFRQEFIPDSSDAQ